MMKYASPVKGDFMDEDGHTYPQCTTDDQVIQTIEHGDILVMTEYYEVWELEGTIAIIPNEVGLLE